MVVIAAGSAATAALLIPLLWLFGVATVAVALLHMRKLPSLLGFLVAGVLVGPAGFGVVHDEEAITIMAEIGVVLLMFTIGLEVSLAALARMAREVLGGGGLQILATALAFSGFATLAGLALSPAVAIGLLASASSTALVLRLLGDRGELGTDHGRLSLAILLAQDFAVVGLMLVLPMLASGDLSVSGIALGLGKGAGVAAAIYIGARFVFPHILQRIVALRSREVFLLITMSAVFGTAVLADALGLSLALGAFVAGLVVSESDYAHQMFAEVLPFRDLFNGLFFASIGLLIDPTVVAENVPLLVFFVVAIVGVKALIVFGTARLLRIGLGSSVVAAVALAQLGEFGLVLAQQGATLGLVSAEHHSLIIATAVITMGLTPLALPIASNWLHSRAKSDEFAPAQQISDASGHVIVVGYGLNGRNVTRAMRSMGVKCVVIELNRTTQVESGEGIEFVYGDATRPALLHHVHVESARALVSAIADAAATRDIVAAAHHANPDLMIVARTRYVSEIEPLWKLGAAVVVPEEFETSIELVARVMRAYGAPESVIHREKRLLRRERYKLLLDEPSQRSDDTQTPALDDMLHNVNVSEIVVALGSHACDRSLRDCDFRVATGASVVAVFGRKQIDNPPADYVLRAQDRLVVVGDAAAIAAARTFVTSGEWKGFFGEEE